MKDDDKIIQQFDKIDIIKSGSLLRDIKNVDIKISEVEDIECKEVVIKNTGNFLNVKETIINIPVEMIVFPFFNAQKQNRRVNFQYSFTDLGVTMSCTLITKNSEDICFQPAVFEEKVYTYLISLYEAKKDDDDDYITFEISDFVTNFLDNKMNRTYYKKVEQALKNLKNTEYEFTVSNHTKLGKYKFEEAGFKLLNYQKIQVGRKKFYKVFLNRNIRQKIKEKRYVKYNSKALMELLSVDPIAARIYKYISKIRYDKDCDSISIRTLAAIIPLQTEQVTERPGKHGTKIYVLSRLKQANKRIKKAFDVLVELGYILKYSSDYSEEDDTFYISYQFNREKDGTCHISSYLTYNNQNESKKVIKNSDNEEIEIIDAEKEVEQPKVSKTESSIKEEIKNSEEIKDAVVVASQKIKKEQIFPNEILNSVKKVKRNIYVSQSWDKRVETKILKIYNERGAEFTNDILNMLYGSLKSKIEISLVQYINGIIKNIDKQAAFSNLTLFEKDVQISKVGYSNVAKNKGLKNKNQINRQRRRETKNLVVRVEEKFVERDYFNEFINLDSFKKLEIEELAIERCCNGNDDLSEILIQMKEKNLNMYYGAIKEHIIAIMKEENK